MPNEETYNTIPINLEWTAKLLKKIPSKELFLEFDRKGWGKLPLGALDED